MKLISETNVSRFRVVDRIDRFSKMLEVNWGKTRRYRHTDGFHSLWSWLGLFDQVETEWDTEWLPVKVMNDADS